MSMRCRAFGVAVAAGLIVGGMAIPASTTAQEPWKVVASGLDNPRHLAFAPGGELYVAEAGSGGSGPCVQHPGLGEFCFGFTGAVTRVRDKGRDKRVVKRLPSIINQDGEVLGPSDLVFNSKHKFVLSIGLGGSNEFRDGFGDDGELLATLVAGKLDHKRVSVVADVMANELANNPDGTDIDSNPVGILKKGSGYVIADAGGNAVVRASKKGNFTTVAPFPPTAIGADAVPTSVVRGPDGAYYVSQLTGFPFPVGGASVLKVQQDGTTEVYATGFTNVIDLAFDRDGTLYVLEIDHDGLLGGDTAGGLWSVPFGGGEATLLSTDLVMPGGIAVGRDGTLYVTTGTSMPNAGTVVSWKP
jgi:hypothetical protein